MNSLYKSKCGPNNFNSSENISLKHMINFRCNPYVVLYLKSSSVVIGIDLLLPVALFLSNVYFFAMTESSVLRVVRTIKRQYEI